MASTAYPIAHWTGPSLRASPPEALPQQYVTPWGADHYLLNFCRLSCRVVLTVQVWRNRGDHGRIAQGSGRCGYRDADADGGGHAVSEIPEIYRHRPIGAHRWC